MRGSSGGPGGGGVIDFNLLIYYPRMRSLHVENKC